MKPFENVTVIPEANLYFDGKVSSRTIQFTDGSKKTLGIMLPGEYSFGTSQDELMEIIAGTLLVQLPGADKFESYGAGTSFYVPANSEFLVKAEAPVDYCCSYS